MSGRLKFTACLSPADCVGVRGAGGQGPAKGRQGRGFRDHHRCYSWEQAVEGLDGVLGAYLHLDRVEQAADSVDGHLVLQTPPHLIGCGIFPAHDCKVGKREAVLADDGFLGCRPRAARPGDADLDDPGGNPNDRGN